MFYRHSNNILSKEAVRVLVMFNIGDLISLSGQNFTSNFPTRIKNLDVENTDNGSFKAPIQPLTMNKKNIFEIQSFH